MTFSHQIPLLQAISPLDGRYAAAVAPLRPWVSEYGLIHARYVVEIHWLQALISAQVIDSNAISKGAEDYLVTLLDQFDESSAERVKALEATLNHDVKAVECYIRELLEAHPEAAVLSPWIHFACTSEDINNLAYSVMLKNARDTVLLPVMQEVLDVLQEMVVAERATPMLSRTHGQPASPTSVGKEVANVMMRFHTAAQQWSAVPLMGKCNGAVGNFNAHRAACPDVDWPKVTADFVESLGCVPQPYTTQIEPHDGLAEFLQALSRCQTILMDWCRDCWGYISLGYFKQKVIAEEVGSSTMPHKVNPIDFENAEGNLGIAQALANHLANKLPLSRWQRDLTDSTVLRNLGSICGYTLLSCRSLLKGMGKLSADRETIRADLQNHPEVLTEAIQTMLRRWGVADAYEQLKALSRGEAVTGASLATFIAGLDVTADQRQALDDLAVESYIGYALELSNQAVQTVKGAPLVKE